MTIFVQLSGTEKFLNTVRDFQERRYIWNKRYKIYLTYLSNYDYYIDDTEYTVYYDGEIEEEFSRKIEKSSRK